MKSVKFKNLLMVDTICDFKTFIPIKMNHYHCNCHNLYHWVKLIYLKSSLRKRKMTKLVCQRNGHLQIELTNQALIFLNERNSDLITRMGINTIMHCKLRKNNSKIYNATYDLAGWALYHKQGDYFITYERYSVPHLAFRTHPDLVAYVENTNQDELKIINIPEGDRIIDKSLGKELEFCGEFEDYPLRFVVVVSDDDVRIL